MKAPETAMHSAKSHRLETPDTKMSTETHAAMKTGALPGTSAAPGVGLLLHLRLTLLRNRVRQLVDETPLKLLLVILFVAAIWLSLYFMFDIVFRQMRRWDYRSAVAIPYIFHIFFVAMTFLLAFSTAILVYGSLFGQAESSFLLAAPNRSRAIVTIMFVEALFFASWSLILLGLPLMAAIGQTQPGLDWRFYATFLTAFLGFVPIPGALGLCAAWAVAMWLPRSAKRVTLWVGALSLGAGSLWWGNLWIHRDGTAAEWLRGFLAEMEILRSSGLPSTWVTNAIKHAILGNGGDAAFYLFVTLSTAIFMSWAAVNLVGRHLMTAFGRSHAAPVRSIAYGGRVSRWLTNLAFFYRPARVRELILKDVRTFLRDPIQWAQLLILFGLLSLYLLYLPRTRPDGFSMQWKAFICFLNYGAVTLILSTFTSRFVFPMISIEGRQMWLVGLWPLSRASVMWAKFDFALTVTALAAATVTYLSIRALELPSTLALVQAGGTLSTCIGLCGLAVGLGARFPSYHESNTGRIAAGLGGTVNLIASIAVVTISVLMMGAQCYRMVGANSINRMDMLGWLLYLGQLAVGVGVGGIAMRIGIRSFRRQEF